jgi:RNA polymerase sigma-70 factor, ECF subfamily
MLAWPDFAPLQMPDPANLPDPAAASNAEDVALMAMVGRGDEKAFERLVAKHQGAVVGTVAKMTGRPSDAEDLAQQVFIRVWKSAPRYTATAKFTTWLFTIVRNLVFNDTRRSYRRHEYSLEARADDLHLEEADVQTPGPDEELQHAELRAAADRAIASLPEAQRLAVVLRRFEDTPYEEIAEILGTTVPAVKSMLFRARQQVREQMKAWLADD